MNSHEKKLTCLLDEIISHKSCSVNLVSDGESHTVQIMSTFETMIFIERDIEKLVAKIDNYLHPRSWLFKMYSKMKNRLFYRSFYSKQCPYSEQSI